MDAEGASLGGAIISETADGKLEHFGTVGWIAAGATVLSLWLAGRVRVADGAATSAEAISLAAAAEASADAGETLMDFHPPPQPSPQGGGSHKILILL